MFSPLRPLPPFEPTPIPRRRRTRPHAPRRRDRDSCGHRGLDPLTASAAGAGRATPGAGFGAVAGPATVTAS